MFPWTNSEKQCNVDERNSFPSLHLGLLRDAGSILTLVPSTLSGTNMEVENPLFVEDFMVFQGAMFHFHVSSRVPFLLVLVCTDVNVPGVIRGFLLGLLDWGSGVVDGQGVPTCSWVQRCYSWTSSLFPRQNGPTNRLHRPP